MRYFKWYKLFVLCLLIISGCAPKIPPKDMQRIEDESRPRTRVLEYRDGTDALRRIININTGIGNTTFFQIKPVENKTGAEDLPYDITQIVTSSVSTLSGPLLQVVPHFPLYTQFERDLNDPNWRRLIPVDPEQIPIQRQIPNVVVVGAITEFDEDISEKESGIDIEGYIPTNIDGTDVDIDIGASFGKGETVSRVTFDLQVMDYEKQTFLPGIQVSNTILVFELKRERNFGFMIYGSGLSLYGKTTFKQGLHQAVRKLVDYSVLQLMGMFYTVPYWKTLDDAASEEGQVLLARWRRDFLGYPLVRQALEIQHLLMKYQLEPAYVDGLMRSQIPPEEYGNFGKATQAFALQFLYTYAPKSTLIFYLERSNFPQNAEVLADLYKTLVEHLPMKPGY